MTLDIISINLWQTLISLINLLLLFLIIKKFLFKPVKAMLAKRREEIDRTYAEAEQNALTARESKEAWEEKLSSAKAEADGLLQNAAETAKMRGDKIVEEAKERAEGILRVAETEAALERRRATDDIKKEIVEVSQALAEKMLEREINPEDHRALIDSFLEKIGDEHG